jgi:hypothetical protein
MADFENLFRKASLTLVDGLLLVLCAASVAYLSVPLRAKWGVALGNAVDTSGDIRVVGSSMAELRRMLIVVPLMAMFIPPGARGQSRESTHVPERLEFFEGHAYMGGDSVKWEHDKLVFVKRVADMSGKGSFAETKEELSPSPEAWKRFWTRIDSLGVWQWKADYHDPKRDRPDGESWALTLRIGAKQLKSKGYNGVPEAYGEFRDAVYKLMEGARHHERE